MPYYTQAQIDNIGAVIGDRVSKATNPTKLATAIDALPDRNLITDSERAKLSSLEGTKFLGTFLTVSAIPTVGAVAGSYADVDAGVGSDAERYIYDVNANKFVKSVSQIAGETAASIKTKYESNANTNAFTDSHKTKLDNITEATDITSFTAALDGALA
ncbi:hypothetical protein [Psychrobacter urativorans]|uniref:Uncharacterized protein n=1 Tax=Psychrobacter urativorans TaxID=45610 RepID=A0A0M4T3F6_9GAMM|nr:hypothetical protein [Psychrobacter urativorans]ALF60315.1 hypothetical protein AOC03_09920 [Psychrobacter urativorans]